MHRRRFLALLALVASPPSASSRAATATTTSSPTRPPATPADWAQLGRRWLEANVDPQVLRALSSGDPSALPTFLPSLADLLQGEYVLDLAAFEDAADLALPLLESRPDTRPLASWLRARLDYFDVVDWLRRLFPPSPPSSPDRPPTPPPVPTPDQQRRAWEREVQGRRPPAGAATWVPRLKPLFRKEGLPPELVWLAEIESSFDPAARSPAGALGLFQLMPGTATDLGLRLRPQDERLIPDKNARAAATYLRQLGRRFREWRLILAAYNAGPGRVGDLLQRRRATSYDAIAPSLPAETQMYVPKFEMVLRQREGRDLRRLALPPRA